MTAKRATATNQPKPRKWCSKRHWFAAFAGLLLAAGAVMYHYRNSLMQWGLEHLLQRTPLSIPELSGIQLGLHQARLADMQFSLQTAFGEASVQLRDITSGYDLKAARLTSINVANARLRVAYRQPEQHQATTQSGDSQAANGTGPVIPVLPLRQIAIETLDIEITTEQGLVAFVGSAELLYDPADGIRVLLQQGEQKIQLKITADLRSAQLSIEAFAASQIAQLNYRQIDQSHQQAELNADAVSLLNWLTSNSLVPANIRSDLLSSTLYQVSPELAAIKLNLQACSNDDFKNIKGRLLLTREQQYLSSSELAWNSPKSRLNVDGHLDMAVVEALALAKPWLPKQADVWQNASGNLMGTFRFKWQPEATLDGEVFLRAYQVGGNAGPVAIQDGFVRLDVTNIVSLAAALEVDLPSLQLGKETEVRNLKIKVQHRDNQLTVEQATLPIFAGTLEIVPGRVDLEQSPIDLIIEVRKLDLGQLLDSLNYPELSGTGTISGKLPLRLAADSFEVRDGILNGIEPGVLRYRGPVVDERNIAFSALRNLRYHSLQGKLNYQPGGDYQLGLRLEGKNPELLSGHPVAFNLKLSGQLPELLQKGILAGDFDKPILEQIKTNGKH